MLQNDRFFHKRQALRNRWIVGMKKEYWTTSNYSKICSDGFITGISCCECGSFLCLFICFLQESQPEGHFILIIYCQSFPKPSKLLRLPAVAIYKPSSALLRVHSKSPLGLESEVWHISFQVLNWMNKKEWPGIYCGTRQGAAYSAACWRINYHW